MLDNDTVSGKMSYIRTNPVDAELVQHGHSWPGLQMRWPMKPRVFKRPKNFFADDVDSERWPEEVELVMHRPRGFEEYSDEELEARLDEEYEQKKQAAWKRVKAGGRKFLGRRGVLRQSRHARATSREERFRIRPRVACRDRDRRIAWLRAHREWLEQYVEALGAWRAGFREVVFPYGTYRMKRVHDVRVADGPPI